MTLYSENDTAEDIAAAHVKAVMKIVEEGFYRCAYGGPQAEHRQG